MTKENSRLFDNKLTKHVKAALQQNAETTASNIYYHPREGGVLAKCIDVSCKKPLHDAGDPHPASSSPEKWLEAYLIRKAKANHWILDLDGHEFQFLYSQLQFRGTESDKPRPLDLLLFERDTACLVVMELKVNRALTTAKRELCYYCGRLNDSIIQSDLRDIFGLGKTIRGVKGYIVWPQKKQQGVEDHNEYGPFGVFEYTPWLDSNVLSKTLKVKFDLHIPAVKWSGCVCDRHHS
jgi:hypothetical protein